MTDAEAKELATPLSPLKRGDTGTEVLRVQEWLNHHGLHVVLDGDFGPATEAAVRAFQEQDRSFGQVLPGVVNETTWLGLTDPMRHLIRSARVVVGDLLDGVQPELPYYIAKVAEHHAKFHPREIGGNNRGPWVRLFMDGQQGPNAPWCAGWATYVLGQVFAVLGQENPWRTFSCDELAHRAQKANRWLRAPKGAARGLVRPGALFLIAKVENDWSHTGIVTRVTEDAFHTLEGNTNRLGQREGTELRARVRPFDTYTDFILINGEVGGGKART